MPIPKRAAKRDTNETEIIQALRAAGASVQQLSIKGCPDLLVGYVDFEGYRANLLMEVKTAKGKLTPDEDTWINAWEGDVRIVRSVEDALQSIGRT